MKNKPTDLLDWLIYARREMRKRVWIPTDHPSGYQELRDGAIPCWWIDQEIERVKGAMNSNLESQEYS